jgi:hypothetical protein
MADAGGSGSASSPLPFPTGGDTHRHLQKKKNTCSRFYLGLFSFPDLFLVLPFLRSLSLLFSYFLGPRDFDWWQNWQLLKDCWRPETGAAGAAVRGRRLCGVLLEAGLWPDVDGVDG